MHKERINYPFRIIAYVMGRDEGPNLPMVFEGLKNQSLRPSTVLFIDDNSLDNSSEIAESYGFKVCRFPYRHPSYVERPELGQIWNVGMRMEDPSKYDFMVQCSSDIVLSREYIKKIIGHMIQDPNLVIASGIVEGEYQSSDHVRGAGRVIRCDFWREYLGEFPFIYGWESYPLFKAQALGYRIQSFPDVKMKAIRPTSMFKAIDGMAMRELGYWPPYAIGRCLLGMMKKPKAGIRMLLSYLFFDGPQVDGYVSRYIQSIQIHKVTGILSRPFRILGKIKRRL